MREAIAMDGVIERSADQLRLVLPDVDVLLRCFTRSHPGLVAINQFQELVAQRRLCLVGAVRHELLSRCMHMTQMQRFAQQLAAFPDIIMQRGDYELAAERRLRLREDAGRKRRKRNEMGIANGVNHDNDVVEARQLLLWSVAKRIDADVWSYDPSWQRLTALGCSLWAASKA